MDRPTDARLGSENPGTALAAYLPRLQLELLGMALPSGEERSVSTLHGAILLVDISGFTDLTRRFEQRGKAGAEEMAGILRTYFGRLSEIVAAYGGDVIAFAGDSALAVWPAADTADMPGAVASSLQAALTIRREVGGNPRINRDILHHRAAISAGALYALHLGGSDGQWQFLLSGGALQEAGAAIRQISMSDLAMTAAAWSHAADAGAAARRAGDYWIVDPRAMAASPPPPRPPATPMRPDLPLGDYVPAFVSARVLAGMGEWLSEFRTVTALFIGFPDFDAAAPAGLAGLQSAVRKMQEWLRRFEGFVYQFLVDDKGLVMIGIFGLPPRAHEDDPLRGVRAAMTIAAELAAAGIRTTIGVATGSAFCSIYGSQLRRQYTALGTALNTAARLMQFGADGVLCDAATATAARERSELRFEECGQLRVKGIDAPILTFRPAPANSLWTPAPGGSGTARAAPLGVVGRTRERQALGEALRALHATGQGGVVVLEGPAGIGKSHLIHELLHSATDLGIAHLAAAGFAIEKSIPYYAWRPVFVRVFALADCGDDAGRQRQRVLARLGRAPELLPLAPLLNAVLPLEFAETEATAQLHGEARADGTRQLLLRVLELHAEGAPRVLVLDDAHWFDSVSWTLARMAAERLPATLCVLATRPSPEESSTAYDELLKLPATVHCQLEALSSPDGLQLACLRLGVQTMQRPIADYVTRQTQGNPLFIEELIAALHSCDAIAIHGSDCRLGARLADSSRSLEQLFGDLRLPGTVQGIIISNVDRLSQQEQLLLKVASVIGQGLSVPILQAVYPLETARSGVPAMAERLLQQNFFQRTADDGFEFRHALIQEVVYDAMPFATRRELHRKTAQWHERSPAHGLQGGHALLAHHWSLAEVPAKAIEYSALAGSQALRNFANLEAVRLLGAAVALDRDSAAADEDPAAARTRRAHWQFQLGSAYVGWSKYMEARDHLERGLALAGRPMPRSVARTVAALLAQIFRQLAMRLIGPRPRALPAGEAERLLEMARAFEGLMEIYFLTDRPIPCLYAVFRSLNLAEQAGPSAELARAYSSTAALVGFMTLRRMADAYFRLASDAARETADPSAEAWVAMTRGFYLTGLGERADARAQLTRSLEIYDRLGDSRHGDDARATLAGSYHLHCEFDASRALAARVYSSAVLRRDNRVQAEAARWCAYNLLALDRLEEAQATLAELDTLRSATMNLGGAHRKQDVAVLGALLSLKRRSFAEALERVRSAELLMRKLADTFDLLMERAGIAEIYVALWNAGLLPTRQLQAEAARAVRAVGKYAAVFPIGRPAALFWKGRLLELRGKRKPALESWRQSCRAATALGVPLYAALAHREVGRHLPAGEPARDFHLGQAQALFESLGMVGQPPH